MRRSRARSATPHVPAVAPAEVAGVDGDPAGAAPPPGPLAAALERLDPAVVVVDGRGVEVYRNATARDLGSARDGRAIVEGAVERLLEQARTGVAVREDVELYGPPEQLFAVAAFPFADESGTGALAVVEDRSAVRRTDTVRRDFVSNISHELKTPVGALGLLAEAIRDEDDPAVMHRLADRMVTEAHRAARTIDDLLELSGIEFGDDTEFEDLDVAALVAEAVSRIDNAAEQAGVEVHSSVQDGLRIVGDRRQLVSALFNLVDNAVKYSPAGGSVEVSATGAEGEPLVLRVEDHGIGIPRRSLERIFERFYRVDPARSRNTGGTGLGLAIVRHVVSNHGGEIIAESVEGQGSTFTLVLPGGGTRP